MGGAETGITQGIPEWECQEPTTVISSEYLDSRGYTNVIDARSDIPAFGRPDNSLLGGNSETKLRKVLNLRRNAPARVCDRQPKRSGNPLRIMLRVRIGDLPAVTPIRFRQPFQASRRCFLHQVGAAAAGALLPMGAVWARSSERRSLSLVHTHTGERLSTVYFEGNHYIASELSRINWLLRDFRTGDVHPIDPAVLDILADLRTLADRDEPYEVISGYRSPKTNAELRQRSSGVAEHSLHLEGRAIDVRLPGFPTGRLHELALGMKRGGVGFYPSSDFIHLDNGRIRHW
jgi:uncharacterized protein YcbK (DUF882 family)